MNQRFPPGPARSAGPGTTARLVVALAIGALLAACDAQRADVVAPPTPLKSASLVEQGRAVYNFRCYFCHGYSGDAKTLAASYLEPPPRDFLSASPADLPPARILDAVRHGRPGTSMKSFAGTLGDVELEAVTAFVFDEFVVRKARNTRYHTPENGWPDHERYAVAFPFARGEIALSASIDTLTPGQLRGRRLYLESCVSCHDRGKPVLDTVTWEARPLSFPRNGYDHRQPAVDAAASATPYRIHDTPPRLDRPTAAQRRGEKLFQENCAFCHAADGSGKNWIGSFLEPHPRNLGDPAFASVATRERLYAAIRDGLKDTSMPAWKSVLSEAQIGDVIAYIRVAFLEKASRAAP